MSTEATWTLVPIFFLTLGNVGSQKEVCVQHDNELNNPLPVQYDSAAQQSLIPEGLADSYRCIGDTVIIIGVNNGRRLCPVTEVDITQHGQTILHNVAIFNTPDK